jgi:hypothetical protein
MSAPRRPPMTFTLCVGAALALAACGGGGGSGKQTNDAGVGPDGGRADVSVDAPSCPALPCLADAINLIASCAPSGACTEQVNTTTGAMVKCFSNGVKIQLMETRFGTDGTNVVMAVKKDGAACYSFTAMQSNAMSDVSGGYQDGAGTQLITETLSGATTTATCPGGSPIVPDADCASALSDLQSVYPFTNATSCTQGTCTF